MSRIRNALIIAAAAGLFSTAVLADDAATPATPATPAAAANATASDTSTTTATTKVEKKHHHKHHAKKDVDHGENNSANGNNAAAPESNS